MYPQRSVMTCGLATALEPPHFNHAPVRGATGASFSRRSRAGSFNPRTRVGCDACRGCLPGPRCWGFNPRTRVGCDIAPGLFQPVQMAFQSTHPRGVRRLSWMPTGATMLGFQSTHPRGVRHRAGPVPARPDGVSIHAPAWGATTAQHQLYALIRVSIHAPAWGATLPGLAVHGAGVVSIHAPAWGAT